MPTVLTPDALAVDAVWSPEQVEHFQNEIERRKGSVGWYHEVTVKDRAGHSVRTPGIHACLPILAALERFGFPRDFTGKTVLDIGCNAGFYSSVAKVRGARSVLGIDYFQHSIEQARLLRDILQLDIDFRQGDGEALGEGLGPFDVVINTGVMYHLQNPMQFLSNMARLTSELMFLESEMLVDSRHSEYAWFIEHEYNRDVSNWWIYGPECLGRMVRAAGFSRAEFKGFAWTPARGEKTPEGLDRQGRGVMLCWK